jgi:(2R)-sulfolactate sulfo-lyase subunit alpha
LQPRTRHDAHLAAGDTGGRGDRRSRRRRRSRSVEHRFLIHRRGDHVGVAVMDIASGERVLGIHMDDDSSVEVEAVDPIPLGHKIAIVDVADGGDVVEYGARIGHATGGFRAGAHVHTHNLRSARW